MTSQLPVLTEIAIRARANEQSYLRGYLYFRDGFVQNIVWRSGLLMAEVQGSDDDPYQVQVLFRANDIVNAVCSCPYDWGGDCKHIVAVLLTVLNTPDVVAVRPPLELLLADLNAEQLRTLLCDLVEYAPQILDYLEQRVILMRGALPPVSVALQTDAPFHAPPPPSFDVTSLKRRIKASIREVAQVTDEYNDSYYDTDLAESLEPAMELAQIRKNARRGDCVD